MSDFFLFEAPPPPNNSSHSFASDAATSMVGPGGASKPRFLDRK